MWSAGNIDCSKIVAGPKRSTCESEKTRVGQLCGSNACVIETAPGDDDVFDVFVVPGTTADNNLDTSGALPGGLSTFRNALSLAQQRAARTLANSDLRTYTFSINQLKQLKGKPGAALIKQWLVGLAAKATPNSAQAKAIAEIHNYLYGENAFAAAVKAAKPGDADEAEAAPAPTELGEAEAHVKVFEAHSETDLTKWKAAFDALMKVEDLGQQHAIAVRVEVVLGKLTGEPLAMAIELVLKFHEESGPEELKLHIVRALKDEKANPRMMLLLEQMWDATEGNNGGRKGLRTTLAKISGKLQQEGVAAGVPADTARLAKLSDAVAAITDPVELGERPANALKAFVEGKGNKTAYDELVKIKDPKQQRFIARKLFAALDSLKDKPEVLSYALALAMRPTPPAFNAVKAYFEIALADAKSRDLAIKSLEAYRGDADAWAWAAEKYGNEFSRPDWVTPAIVAKIKAALKVLPVKK